MSVLFYAIDMHGYILDELFASEVSLILNETDFASIYLFEYNYNLIKAEKSSHFIHI